MTTSTPTKVTFERILIPTDFSDISDRAVGYAKSIAKQANSQLLLAHVNPPVNPIAPPEAGWVDQEAIFQRFEERLEQIGAALQSEGFRAKAISLTGPLQDEIRSVVKQENVDLIVLGTRAKKGFERLMFGSDAEAVLRHVSCPVLTIGPAVPEPTDQLWPPKNVVCATTLAAGSARIAAYAYTLACHFGSRFALFHVHAAGQSHADDWESFEYLFKQQLPVDLHPESSFLTLLSKESPATKITDFAKRRAADLIVMGAYTASAAATHFAHGTASEVFAEAPCPVMTLHEM